MNQLTPLPSPPPSPRPLTTAEAEPAAECSIHGSLPLSKFTPDDLRSNRHRCRDCVAAGVRKWRAQHPLKVMWMRFVERLRKQQQQSSMTSDWSWRMKGKRKFLHLLKQSGVKLNQLTVDQQEKVKQQYVLKWEKGEILLHTK
jgi:hypothetical protein